MEEEIIGFIQAPQADADFNALALRLFALQKKHNPVYARWSGLFPEPQTWKEIPAVPQQAFKISPLRSYPGEQTTAIFQTSGTTGQGPGNHYFRTLRVYQAAATAGWRRHGLAHHHVLALLPSPHEAPHSSLSRMAGWLAAENDFFIRDGVAHWPELLLTLSLRREPVLIFATAIAFLDFFEWLGSREISLPPGSLAVETGGYKGTHRSLTREELYTLFEKHLGLQDNAVHNEYGMTELSSQFYASGASGLHSGPPWLRATVINPTTRRECAIGETGVLQLFDLANVGSVACLLTQDLAVRAREGFYLLGRDPAATARGCSIGADELLSPA